MTNSNIILIILLCPFLLFAELGDVLHTLPAPGHYSTGLAWDGEHLWVVNIADASHPDNDWYQIYQISPEDGEVLSSIPTYPWFYHGLTFHNGYLWGEHNYNEVVKMTTAGEVLFQFPVNMLAVGLAYDWVNGILYQSSTQPGAIFAYDPETGTLLSEFHLQTGMEHGWGDLAFDGTNLWHTNSAEELIYKLDPNSGEILTQFAAPSTQCQGLTFDGEFLWVSDSNLELIYKVDIEFEPTDPCSEYELGDSNLDGQINVLDILVIVNYILGPGNDLPLCQSLTMDPNHDGSYNVVDIIYIVNIILEG